MLKTDYRSIFREIGISEEDIQKRLFEMKNEFFYSDDRVYFTVGEDMGYILDTGNNDVRTEGMSYGMMITVQLDMKEEFDRLWKWAYTYMYMTSGWNEGYFAWSCKPDGSRNSDGPAPDGEEFFAMALFFASHRWGEGEGIYAYSKFARDILSAALHKGSGGREGHPMWNLDNYQILFVPGVDFTDPSYHCPHFYDLFSIWCNEEDREFWSNAAVASRKFLVNACHPVTGLSAEYSEFSGKPYSKPLRYNNQRHDWFYSDAYRTALNIALDYSWFGENVGQIDMCSKIQKTLLEDMRKGTFHIYEIDGTICGEEALHPVAVLATTAAAGLCRWADDISKEWAEKFYNTPLRKGDRRYYDNCLYFFSFLLLSGHYQIW